MKKLLIYAFLSFIVNSAAAKHELSIKVYELKVKNAKKNYPGGKLFKLSIANKDTVLILDSINGQPFMIRVLPVLVSDNKNTTLQFSLGIYNYQANPKRPDVKGDNKEIAMVADNSEYGYNLKIVAKTDGALIPFNPQKPGNEQMQVLIKRYQLKIKNRVINTEEWEGPLYLLANISTDTAWTNIKKGVQYGLVRNVVCKSFNGEKVYSLVLDVYEKKNGKTINLTQLKIEDINPGTELEASYINCKNCTLQVENILLTN